jgi:hypothetical protein
MIDLPGPEFVSRPGWGGQLRRWMVRDGSTLVIFLVIILVVAFVVRFLWARIDAPLAQTPTPTPTAQSITLYAESGDGMTNIAARALDLYVAVQPTDMHLDSARHLFAVDALARSVCWCPLQRNQEVTFSTNTLSTILDHALNLSPTQKAAWSRLLQ